MRDSITLDSTRLQRLQQISLWDFALSLYAMPGVEAACLTLQDEYDVDVCELLFHCWLYSCGLEVTPAEVATIRRERRQWQHCVTEVLRGLRSDLKAQATTSESIAALRELIKQAELKAERENLQRWQAWVLEPTSDKQRVGNVAQISPDAANWLRNQLFHNDNALPATNGLKSQMALHQALQTLTYQLDPHHGAR